MEEIDAHNTHILKMPNSITGEYAFEFFICRIFPKLHSGYCPPTLRMPAGCYLLSFPEVMEDGAVMGMGSCWLLRWLILGGVVLSSWGLQQHLDFGAPSWGGTLLPAEGEETRVAVKHLQCTGQKAQPWLLTKHFLLLHMLTVMDMNDPSTPCSLEAEMGT